jgi:hypothetical protein
MTSIARGEPAIEVTADRQIDNSVLPRIVLVDIVSDDWPPQIRVHHVRHAMTYLRCSRLRTSIGSRDGLAELERFAVHKRCFGGRLAKKRESLQRRAVAIPL